MENPDPLISDTFSYEYLLNDDVCRLCLSQNVNIISEGYVSKINEFTDKIFYCLDILITTECIVKYICHKCSSNVEKFYDFKIACKRADEALKQVILKQNAQENTEVKTEHTDIDFIPKEEGLFQTLLDSKVNTFLDSLYHSDSNSCEEFTEKNQRTTQKTKNKYKLKRTATYCNICRTDLTTKDDLIEHKSTFHGVENGLYKCFGCEKRFKSPKTRLGHEINFCKELKDGYKCSICDRFLPKRRIYEFHMKDHRLNVDVDLPAELFKCRTCGDTFKTRAKLIEHVDVHKDKKHFVCERCGRVFTRQDYLQKHMLTHTGVKQHVCPHCGFRAAQRSSLTVHIRKHTGERPFSCEQCGQRCVSSSNLHAHRRRHAGLKRYQCTVCSKKFGYKLSLEEHVSSTHQSTKSHTCSTCGAAYSRVRGLKRHIKAKHDMDLKENELTVQTYTIKVVSADVVLQNDKSLLL